MTPRDLKLRHAALLRRIAHEASFGTTPSDPPDESVAAILEGARALEREAGSGPVYHDESLRALKEAQARNELRLAAARQIQKLAEMRVERNDEAENGLQAGG